MVDYTRPEYRDASWRRWKGGQKLADDLRVFYTSKKAQDRINRNNNYSVATGFKTGVEKAIAQTFENLRRTNNDRRGGDRGMDFNRQRALMTPVQVNLPANVEGLDGATLK